MLEYHIAHSQDDYDAVVALVMKVYSKSGYIPENIKDGKLSINDYTRTDSAATITTHWEERLCGTVSIVSDSPFGLPADSTYKSEIDTLRKLTPSLAEICQFAIDTSVIEKVTARHPLENLNVTLGLFLHTICYCTHKNIETLCFVVNPKHKTFYTSLGAEIMGEEKIYAATNNVPAVFMHAPTTQLLKNIQNHSSTLIKEIGWKPITPNFYSELEKTNSDQIF